MARYDTDVQIIPTSVERLITELEKLPGIGPKSASRLAFYLIKTDNQDVDALGNSLLELKQGIQHCRTCFNFSESETCAICASASRDDHQICVVEDPLDIVAIERAGTFKGRYHVLHGAIAPIEGVGPEQLKVAELIERLKDVDGKAGITEVIIATNPNLEGEATALYIQKLIKPLVPKVTRLASGLPMGGDVEYADELTLSRALEGRQEF
ncbi:MAG TPA: recombination mediator RecR [Patescibacteria group bacterium]|jgi:recombination protein RecR